MRKDQQQNCAAGKLLQCVLQNDLSCFVFAKKSQKHFPFIRPYVQIILFPPLPQNPRPMPGGILSANQVRAFPVFLCDKELRPGI